MTDPKDLQGEILVKDLKTEGFGASNIKPIPFPNGDFDCMFKGEQTITVRGNALTMAVFTAKCVKGKDEGSIMTLRASKDSISGAFGCSTADEWKDAYNTKVVTIRCAVDEPDEKEVKRYDAMTKEEREDAGLTFRPSIRRTFSAVSA